MQVTEMFVTRQYNHSGYWSQLDRSHPFLSLGTTPAGASSRSSRTAPATLPCSSSGKTLRARERFGLTWSWGSLKTGRLAGRPALARLPLPDVETVQAEAGAADGDHGAGVPTDQESADQWRHRRARRLALPRAHAAANAFTVSGGGSSAGKPIWVAASVGAKEVPGRPPRADSGLAPGRPLGPTRPMRASEQRHSTKGFEASSDSL